MKPKLFFFFKKKRKEYYKYCKFFKFPSWVGIGPVNRFWNI